MKKFVTTLVAVFALMATNAKTLIVYYSFTNNVHKIVTELQAQTGADAVRIEPAENGLDYAADNYALGSALISAIRNNPDSASSYPGIKPVDVDFDEYDTVIVATPLWWNNMAAPLQTYLFHDGMKMAGKKIGLVVSSASSGISMVESDAHRLIPDGDFLTPSLWIRASQVSSCHSMLSDWLEKIEYKSGISPVASATGIDLKVMRDAIIVDGEFDLFSLYSLSGRKILESSDSAISTSAVSPGWYVAHIIVGRQSVTMKIAVPSDCFRKSL